MVKAVKVSDVDNMTPREAFLYGIKTSECALSHTVKEAELRGLSEPAVKLATACLEIISCLHENFIKTFEENPTQ